MKEYSNSLVLHSHRYIRNPLGIIALFISFIYLMAALVLKLPYGNLEYSLRAALVWFLIIFPVCVLFVFSDLVMNHHQKLYGPMDFRDDKSFLSTIPPDEKIENIHKEFQENVTESETEHRISKEEQVQRTLLAEELFIKLFSNSFDIKFERNIRFQSLEGHSEFDGLGIKDNLLVAIEVKYTLDGKISDSILAKQASRFMSIYSNISKFPNVKHFSAILGIVKDDNIKQQIFPTERINKLVDKLPYNLRVIEYNLSELKNVVK